MDNKPKLSIGKLWKVRPARDYFWNCRNTKRRQTERCLRDSLHFVFPPGTGARPTLDLLRNSSRRKYMFVLLPNEIKSTILVLDAQIPKHVLRGYRLEPQNCPPDRILT
jgi:hypothetical protein